MYCPQCGAQNESKPSFCRQCGHRLLSVQLALDGRVDQVSSKFSSAEDLLAGGLITFAIFMLNGLIALAIWGTTPFTFTILLGFAISLPIVLTGLVRVDRLRRLLDPKEEPKTLPLEQPEQPLAALPAARPTDPLDSRVPMPGSVTEHTTFRLKTPEPEQ